MFWVPQPVSLYASGGTSHILHSHQPIQCQPFSTPSNFSLKPTMLCLQQCTICHDAVLPYWHCHIHCFNLTPQVHSMSICSPINPCTACMHPAPQSLQPHLHDHSPIICVLPLVHSSLITIKSDKP